jgi:hypothetical protein
VTSIVEFLQARLAEDQADFAEVHARNCECLRTLPLPCDCSGPARALREVEAKRRIVKAHEPVHPVLLREGAPSSDEGLTILSYCPVCETEEPPCPTLRALASVYADHPDCQEEWVV